MRLLISLYGFPTSPPATRVEAGRVGCGQRGLRSTPLALGAKKGSLWAVKQGRRVHSPRNLLSSEPHYMARLARPASGIPVTSLPHFATAGHRQQLWHVWV